MLCFYASISHVNKENDCQSPNPIIRSTGAGETNNAASYNRLNAAYGKQHYSITFFENGFQNICGASERSIWIRLICFNWKIYWMWTESTSGVVRPHNLSPLSELQFLQLWFIETLNPETKTDFQLNCTLRQLLPLLRLQSDSRVIKDLAIQELSWQLHKLLFNSEVSCFLKQSIWRKTQTSVSNQTDT